MQRAIHFKALVLAMASVGLVSLPHLATANPSGGQVVAGNATIHQETASKIGITQTTDKAIIDWLKFSIGANEHVQFYQPSASSVTLNRVVGQDPSQILGRLTANGQVFLVNPNGIYFGKNAQIDVAGLVASTHNIRNEDFMAGRYVFDIPGKPGAAVINEGQIRIADTGVAAFIAPSVANRGIIAAKLGKIALASANGFTLDFHGDDLVAFLVSDEVAQTAFDLDGTPLLSFVENSGKIEAQGGYVLLSAKAAENAIHSVINQSGIIEATSVGQQNGEIVLNGGQHGLVNIAGTLDTSGKGSGETGGKVQITGEKIDLLSGTNINAVGDQGGGTVLVGGDYLGGKASDEQLAQTGMSLEATEIPTSNSVDFAEGARIDASAVSAGNGGKVVVWADDTLRYDGIIYARGGLHSGDGGLVETSGKENLYVRGTVDAGATNGSGGLWFLDPLDVIVANSGGTILPSSITSALNSGTNYTLQTTSGSRPGSITVRDDIRKTAGGTATLNLYTDGAVILNQGGRIVSTSGMLNVNIDARYGVANPGYGLVAIGNDTAYAIETNGGQVDITGLIQTYQGKAIKTNGGLVLARTTPTANDSDTRGFIGIGPVPLNDTSAYTIDAGNGNVTMRATGGTITLDDHAIKGNAVSLRGDVYARPNILSFNMADEASRQRIENGFGGASGYGTNFPGNDDNSTSVSIASLAGTGLTLLGRSFGETIYLSNNGYMRLDTGDGTFTPYPLNSTNNPIVAAYFGDVDTRGTGNVYYATSATANDNKAVLTWIGAGYYNYGTNKTNTFQLQVENLGVETNMRLSYQQLQWTTGSASGGSNGLGGTVARAGFAIPGTNETIRFELPSSGRETDMLALASLPGNTGKIGVWSFRLWPEATPPNYRNGRFEVAANTLTVNGSSSGHQLERGAPGSSNVENVDRRRTEDYLSRLLIGESAPHQVRLPVSEPWSIPSNISPPSLPPNGNHLHAEYVASDILPFAMFANAIYGDATSVGSWERFANDRATITYDAQLSGPGSTIDSRPHVVDDPFGFHASAYRSPNSNTIIVAFAGTTATSPADWMTNISHLNQVPQQYLAALEFVRHLIDQGTPPNQIVLTGHSLGGGLAQFVALALGLPAVTFNSAGLWAPTINAATDQNNSNRIPSIVNYVAESPNGATDLVAQTGVQMGEVRAIPISESGVLARHSIGNMISAMDDIITPPSPIGPITGTGSTMPVTR